MSLHIKMNLDLKHQNIDDYHLLIKHKNVEAKDLFISRGLNKDFTVYFDWVDSKTVFLTLITSPVLILSWIDLTIELTI